MDQALLARVEREVLGWPGVSKRTDGSGPGGVGVTGYRVGRRQIGHIHHDGVADLQFPRAVHDELVRSGRARPHRGGFAAVVSYPLRTEGDVPGLLELFRMNYERIRSREAELTGEVRDSLRR